MRPMPPTTIRISISSIIGKGKRHRVCAKSDSFPNSLPAEKSRATLVQGVERTGRKRSGKATAMWEGKLIRGKGEGAPPWSRGRRSPAPQGPPESGQKYTANQPAVDHRVFSHF